MSLNYSDVGVAEIEAAKSRRRLIARRRFKYAIRFVINNLVWLAPDYLIHSSSSINLFSFSKRKGMKFTRRVLTKEVKYIMSRPPESRSANETELVLKFIGDLTSFRKYPTEVKTKLAANTRFTCFGPDRVIARENRPAEAMYYIMSGQIDARVLTVDPITGVEDFTTISTLTSGKTFGESSLLHNKPRKNLMITTQPTELIYLEKAKFDLILKSTIEIMWNRIQIAMDKFSYFETWDHVTKKECCVLAKMRTINRGQFIFRNDDDEAKHWVYFITEGTCTLIEPLHVRTRKVGNKTKFSLYIPPQPTGRPSRDEDQKKIKLVVEGMKLDVMPDVISQTVLKNDRRRSTKQFMSRSKVAFSTQEIKDVQYKMESRPSLRFSQSGSIINEEELEGNDGYQTSTYLNLPSDVKTHFMQVCQFSELACCFGEEPSFQGRYLIANTKVECLVIPLYWIEMQGKQANIWIRIKQYLNSHIPSTQDVFNEFLEQRKWREFKESLRRGSIVNNINNVPYSIRIEQDYNFNKED